MTHQSQFDGLIAANKEPTNEWKVQDTSAPPSASDGVRAKLAECQLTDKDMADAVDWARTQAPTN